LAECIEAAEPYPISGVHRVSDYLDEIEALYDSLTETGAPQKGLSTGWVSVDGARPCIVIRPSSRGRSRRQARRGDQDGDVEQSGGNAFSF
jgi:hypothetical protein